MKKFFIITRNLNKNRDIVERLKSEIESKGGECEYAASPEDEDKEQLSVPEGYDCIITIGGDGTIIGAAQMTFGMDIPLLGVNRGHLGYLCELDEVGIFSAIDRLLNDDYEIEERMMLKGYVDSAGADSRMHALNDIVISAGYGISVLHLSVSVNGKHLYSYICDGLILSTPTGSTAYNLSANGPIVDPKARAILLTPINPHTLNSRSIVLDQNDEICVEIIKRRNKTEETGDVAFDGAHKRVLHIGEKLLVKRAENCTNMVILGELSFLERIGKKLRAD